MAWQGTLARVLGRPCEVPGHPQAERQTPMDKIDAIDRTIHAEGFVNTVNFVNRGPGARFALLAQAQGWPFMAQWAAVALAAHHQAQRHDADGALLTACRAVRDALVEGGELAALLTADPPPPAMPSEAQGEEVDGTVARLMAGGWEPAKARLLAPALVARRLGLPEPPEPDLPGGVIAALLAGLPVGGVQ